MRAVSEHSYGRLIHTISKQFYRGFHLEFLGILDEINLYDTETKNFSTLDYLIEKKIYLKDESGREKDVEFDIEGEQILEYELDGLDQFFYNNTLYYYNEQIYYEVYRITEYVIEERMKIEFDQDLDEISCELLGYREIEEKARFLTDKRATFFKSSLNAREFMIYLQPRINLEDDAWADLIIQYLCFDPKFIRFFLTSFIFEGIEGSLFYKDDFKTWVDYARKKKLIDFCDKELDNLKNINEHSNSSAITKSLYIPKIKIDGAGRIIKDNYVLLYAYIVDNYQDIKNKAFFSYLFRFFSDNEFLIKGKIKSSTRYNEFLIKNELLETFSKVIQQTDYSGVTDRRMFDIFKSFMDSYNKFHSN